MFIKGMEKCMKKLLAIFIAVFMTVSVMPSVFAGTVHDDSVSVTYTGSTVNASSLGVGNYFFFTVGVSENSRMWSGHWLVEYPERYITPVEFSSTWSGSIIAQIEESMDDDTCYSDMPTFVSRLSYEGMTGNNPYGEAGKKYTDVGMYIVSFDYGGMMAGGQMFRIKYRIDALPTTATANHDNGGYYLELPITVLESRYWVEGAQIAPGVDYYRTHEQINIVNGKVYMQTLPASYHTVRFFDINGQVISVQQVNNGSAATAPAIDQVVDNDTGCFVFYDWDTDFSSVTQDIDVHPDYVLLGDADLNGRVDSSDAVLVLRSAMNLFTLNPRQACAGNVDGEGGITSLDAVKLLRYVMNLIPTLAY